MVGVSGAFGFIPVEINCWRRSFFFFSFFLRGGLVEESKNRAGESVSEEVKITGASAAESRRLKLLQTRHVFIIKQLLHSSAVFRRCDRERNLFFVFVFLDTVQVGNVIPPPHHQQ